MKLHFWIGFVFLFSIRSWSNQIAFTFDDAPKNHGKLYTGPERTQLLLEKLKRHGIQTVFFSNSSRLGFADGRRRLKQYAEAGHFIANHSHSHPDLHKIKADLFAKEIIEADLFLKTYATFKKWFRFPFLHEGKTVEDRDAIRAHLKNNNYSQGYVTVDNYDYFIDGMVQDALAQGEKVHLDRACTMLVDLMWEGIQFYDEIAKKHIGQVRHVLLMHESDIEAHCLDSLVERLQKNKWSIISPELAYTDPLLAVEPDTLYLNQGRVAALAHQKTGIKYVSKWESQSALRREFARRRIVETQRAR
jgi:peptidoglycan-N-acetylglucosamine deacetylase